MTTPSCSAPGCTFESAGNVGLCTNSVGTLSNAEIADRIAKNNLTPVHYVDAAVKVITWDDQWVAYDDAETYKQKVDFARSLCLGGVMVWALSSFIYFPPLRTSNKIRVLTRWFLGQDSKDLASSAALAKITQRNIFSPMLQIKTISTPVQPYTNVTTSMKHRQCRWYVRYFQKKKKKKRPRLLRTLPLTKMLRSDCGKGCDSVGDHFVNVMRSSGTNYEKVSNSESIQDSTFCGNKGILRQFCCPTDSPIPTCAHFFFNNGKCSGDTTNDDRCYNYGSVEVGSYSGDCNN